MFALPMAASAQDNSAQTLRVCMLHTLEGSFGSGQIKCECGMGRLFDSPSAQCCILLIAGFGSGQFGACDIEINAGDRFKTKTVNILTCYVSFPFRVFFCIFFFSLAA
jgi:hypothetical protein